MLGVSGMMGTASGDGAAAAAAEAQESGGTSSGSGGTAATVPGGGAGGGFSEEDKTRMEDDGERAEEVGGGGGGGGNRWPRQETLALLKIRSDMDVVFRDSSLKGPLWEQVSRKMADLGYHRSAKKCKEKFENVYKYHKRTKEGRSTKPEGKTYRFFDQLEALENTSSVSAQMSALPPRAQPPPMAGTATIMAPVPIQTFNSNQNPPIPAQITLSSGTNNVVSGTQNTTTSTTPPQSFNNFINSTFPPSQTVANVSNPPQSGIVPPSHKTISKNLLSNSPSSSSSTSSDEDIERRHKRKRKWKDFFERLMKDVIDKQEELQKRFLETLEKRERDRMIREEAWRVQEMARINREHDLLVQERSMAAARESALVTFLQKITQHQNPQNPNSTNGPQLQISVQQNPLPQQAPQPPPPAAAVPAPAPATATPVVLAPSPSPAPPHPLRTVEITPKSDNGGENFMGPTSSRWPKAEVQALIQLRTSLDNKYQENGPKGPLWEDISAGMRKRGYNRNAKRCKEKWENINKYFKKVKESNKKRPEDSKTCPYFHQLEALYKEKAKTDASSYNTTVYANAVKPENPMIPIMARPEQQWPLPQDHQQDQEQPQQQQHGSASDEHEDENIDDQNDHDDDDDDDGDDDEEDEGNGYEIVTNKPSSVATTVQ